MGFIICECIDDYRTLCNAPFQINVTFTVDYLSIGYIYVANESQTYICLYKLFPNNCVFFIFIRISCILWYYERHVSRLVRDLHTTYNT